MSNNTTNSQFIEYSLDKLFSDPYSIKRAILFNYENTEHKVVVHIIKDAEDQLKAFGRLGSYWHPGRREAVRRQTKWDRRSKNGESI